MGGEEEPPPPPQVELLSLLSCCCTTLLAQGAKLSDVTSLGTDRGKPGREGMWRLGRATGIWHGGGGGRCSFCMYI